MNVIYLYIVFSKGGTAYILCYACPLVRPHKHLIAVDTSIAFEQIFEYLQNELTWRWILDRSS